MAFALRDSPRRKRG